ncbi:hypothetical protein GCM10008957_51420 [Deinococcus ruber]|uniref:Uncharacterized protein n=1 Tax=Deinococcus ruber TaxID=1848197 RepID=A0A918KVC5_9DEIO|nr:hypothetical protein GCM10008957_51420 [Deinococcus ruber]
MNLVNHLLTCLLTFSAAHLFTVAAWGRRHRNLSLADLDNGRTVACQWTFQSFSTVFQDMPTIQNLLRCRCTFTHSLFIVQRAVTTDELNVWVLLQPCSQRARASICEAFDRPTCRQVDDDRPIDVTTPKREIIHTNDLGDGSHDWRQEPCCPQHGGCTHPTLHLFQQGSTGIPSKHHGHLLDGCQRPPTSTNGRHESIDKSLTKDLSTTQWLCTDEAANGQFERHCRSTCWEITEVTAIPTVNSSTGEATRRTSRGCLDAGGDNGDGLFDLHRIQPKPRKLCQKESGQRFIFHTSLEAM